MTHMVIHRSSEGAPVYHPTESLEEAARHVEQLRNAGQGADARIFRMEEIPMEVKTYYKVEVPGVAAPAPAKADAAPAPSPDAVAPAADVPAAAAPAAAPAEAPAAAPTAATPPSKGEPAAAGANGTGGRFGLFGKG
jgi:hypothetical protein